MVEQSLIDRLWPWAQFLDAQTAVFNAGILKATNGVGHIPDEASVAFLATENDLLSDRISDLIEEFIKTGRWAATRENEWLHLRNRADGASGLLLRVFRNQLRPENIRPGMPDPSDRPQFIRWLFLDTWAVGGKAYIQALTDKWLADNKARA
jgi:hypothetical protein